MLIKIKLRCPECRNESAIAITNKSADKMFICLLCRKIMQVVYAEAEPEEQKLRRY